MRVVGFRCFELGIPRVRLPVRTDIYLQVILLLNPYESICQQCLSLNRACGEFQILLCSCTFHLNLILISAFEETDLNLNYY